MENVSLGGYTLPLGDLTQELVNTLYRYAITNPGTFSGEPEQAITYKALIIDFTNFEAGRPLGFYAVYTIEVYKKNYDPLFPALVMTGLNHDGWTCRGLKEETEKDSKYKRWIFQAKKGRKLEWKQ